MAMFTPSFSGLKGRALFSLLFAAPMIHATDSVTTKDGETITVTADANTATEATDGYAANVDQRARDQVGNVGGENQRHEKVEQRQIYAK